MQPITNAPLAFTTRTAIAGLALLGLVGPALAATPGSTNAGLVAHAAKKKITTSGGLSAAVLSKIRVNLANTATDK